MLSGCNLASRNVIWNAGMQSWATDSALGMLRTRGCQLRSSCKRTVHQNFPSRQGWQSVRSVMDTMGDHLDF